MSDQRPLVIGLPRCAATRRATAFLDARDLPWRLRHLVEEPPTGAELDAWLESARVPLRRLLNPTSPAYRALGKETVHAADDTRLREWLLSDPSLWRRPVLVLQGTVVVGFDLARMQDLFASVPPRPECEAPDPHDARMIAEIELFAGRDVPPGWARCDGRELWIDGHQALFSVIGATYGGDGCRAFALPRLAPLGPNGPHHLIALTGLYPIRQ
jgi:Spx/MgsR family transcriptional regulator